MIKQRLAHNTFEFPLAEIRHGYRSAIYFNRTKKILQSGMFPQEFETLGTMQVFQKNNAILCGMDEALAMIAQCTGHWSNEKDAQQAFSLYMSAKLEARADSLNVELATRVVELERTLDEMWINTYDQLIVEALNDGDIISPWEPVLKIKGDYASFAHLESVYLGILARATKIATNTHKVVEAANGKQVLFFADRFDRWSNQTADGYAAYVGGAGGFACDSMGAWWGEPGLGTMPHSLIAMAHGHIPTAAAAFNKTFPDVNTVALVDFNNNCVEDALACARVLNNDLWGVRLDTSENLVDPSVMESPNYGMSKPTGVNPMLVEAVRRALDTAGYRHVKIIVSGGFDVDKITKFEAYGVPVDAYAVGSSLLAGSNDFTADIVEPISKFGRKELKSNRLSVVKN